jgi:hypothetical protein
MEEMFQDFLDTITGYLPGALGALGILVGGWLLAVIVSAVVRGLMNRIGADRRVSTFVGDETDQVNLTRWVSRTVYYLILLFVVVGFLQALNLTIVAEPIQQLLNTVLGYLPALIGAAALILTAWIVASALRFVINRALKAVKLDERISTQADLETAADVSISSTLANVVYWLVFLLFLPAILGALGVQGILEPVQGVVDEILSVLPNLLGAGLILFVGWLAARIVRQILTNLLIGLGLDRMSEQFGLAEALGDLKLSQIIGTVIYVLILVPVVIGALNTLEIEAISGPAAEMLTTMLGAIPAIFGALLLIGIAYFVARVVGTFVGNVLAGVGFNRVLAWIGMGEAPEGGRSPSQIVGYLTSIAIMLFAVIEASNLLGFTILAQLVSDFLVASSGVLLGLVIFGFGLYLAGLAARVIQDAGVAQANLLAPVARVAIVVFSGALALRQTGIAEDIVNMAFGILLGTVAVAAALAFGLGARDIAGKEIERWIDATRKKQR